MDDGCIRDKGVWFFRLKRLARDAGLKTTQKFAAGSTSILLKDDTGRQGIFDLVQFTVQPSGHECEEDWYTLADHFRERSDREVPSPDLGAERTPFDPF